MLFCADQQQPPESMLFIMASNANNQTTPLLTARQKACLQLTAEGMTAQAAAHHLGISVRMVRWHLQQARERLGASSSVQAVLLASKLGLLEK
jgi:DNA-binding CsgD family transcriptional regulator